MQTTEIDCIGWQKYNTDDRKVFMKGIDYSYYYESEN